MARTPSNMVKLGTQAPSFKLINTINDKLITSDTIFNKNGTIIMFICNHCPFVIHVLDEIISISEEYFENISFIAISSNDIVNYPEDSPELMKKLAIDKKFKFPYLYDENQEVAKNYDAACTPDFFLYNKNKKLIYRGQLDDSRPGNNIPITGNDLRKAIVSLIDGKEIEKNQKPSIGCNIKWI
tara:strand:+ start:1128 stop:1679 length:552 start_codon:yes stop_codon:yes gene_type:complete